jgi:hypothetical protein
MENKNNKSFSCETIRPVRPSFYEILEEVKVQVEFDCFKDREKAQANEICLIITEVMKLNPENEIKIAGVMLSVGMVQEVYGSLENDHIALVLENFQKVTYEIRNKKAYLRTAIYNAVFEFESHYENQYRKDFGI